MDCSLPAKVPINELLALSVPEKIAIIGALWDSIDASAGTVPIPSWQVQELERRENADRESSEPTVSWEQAVDQARNSHVQSRPS